MNREMRESGVDWIGEIPDNWSIKRLKYGVKIRNLKATNDNFESIYIGLENVESYSGKFIQTDSIYDSNQAIIVRKNDVLFGKLRPYLAKVYFASKEALCSGEFAVFYDFEFSQYFLMYQLLSHWFINVVDSSTYGTKMPRANIDFIRNLPFLFPSKSEQIKIVEYLEIKCQRIDRLIALQEEMITELQAYKQSVITEAVTKGLDPDIPMKDSGMELIREIPESWVIYRLRFLGSLSSSGIDKKIVEGESLYKSVQYMNVYSNSMREIGKSDDYLVVSASEKQSITCSLIAGDVLFTNSSETPDDIGHSTVIIENLDYTLYGYHLMRFRPNIKLDLHFTKYLFGSEYIRKWFSFRARGMTRYGLTHSDFSDARIILPPLYEQGLISNYLDEQCKIVDRLISLKKEKITGLKEFKKSLIYECVTGKRDCGTRGDKKDAEYTGKAV